MWIYQKATQYSLEICKASFFDGGKSLGAGFNKLRKASPLNQHIGELR